MSYTNGKLPPAFRVETDAALRALVDKLASADVLAVDTEANGMHAYTEQVCLFQLSTRTTDYIIDPLAINDMTPLGDLLADAAIEKVFHAAEYDLMGIRRDYDFDVRNVFDTMVAARVVGHSAVGLDTLLKAYMGITLDKSHQRDDWSLRPLPDESLRYAQLDTHYLLDLRDALHRELVEMGRMDEAQEGFDDLMRFPVEPRAAFDPEGYWEIGRPNRLNRRQMVTLRELYLLRERLAQADDLPPYRVISNGQLLTLAQRSPSSRHQLRSVRGLRPAVIRRHGDEILEAVADSQGKKLPRPPKPPGRPDIDVVERYKVLKDWRKQRAQERGVESDVILPKATLWEVARDLPTTLDELSQVSGMGAWRLATYGTALLDIVADFLETE